MSKHTPAPWKVDGLGIYAAKQAGAICLLRGPNATRIVECVNALEGLDPKALGEALKAFEAAANTLRIMGKHDRRLDDINAWCSDALAALRGEG